MRFVGLFLGFIFLGSPVGAWTHLGSQTYGWKQTELEFYVNSSNCSLPEEELYLVIDRALEAWNHVPFSSLRLKRKSQSASDGEIEFRNLDATQLPLIVCSNQLSDYGDVDSDRVLGFVPYFVEDSAGFVNYSGLVLNSEMGAQAELSQFDRGEIELVLAHEIGHVLGLGHSSDPDALMYFQLNKNFLLITQDDQDGIAHLYPENLFKGLLGCASVRQGAHKSADGSHDGRSLFFLFLGVLVIALLGFSFPKVSKEPLP